MSGLESFRTYAAKQPKPQAVIDTNTYTLAQTAEILREAEYRTEKRFAINDLTPPISGVDLRRFVMVVYTTGAELVLKGAPLFTMPELKRIGGWKSYTGPQRFAIELGLKPAVVLQTNGNAGRYYWTYEQAEQIMDAAQNEDGRPKRPRQKPQQPKPQQPKHLPSNGTSSLAQYMSTYLPKLESLVAQNTEARTQIIEAAARQMVAVNRPDIRADLIDKFWGQGPELRLLISVLAAPPAP